MNDKLNQLAILIEEKISNLEAIIELKLLLDGYDESHPLITSFQVELLTCIEILKMTEKLND